MLAIRYNLGLAVNPRASLGPALVVASRGQPLLNIVSDPPWFLHPFPFVWLFCNEKSIIESVRNMTQSRFSVLYLKIYMYFNVSQIYRTSLKLTQLFNTIP